MTWTSEKPTVPGWYWYRDNAVPSRIVEVSTRSGGALWVTRMQRNGCFVDRLYGQWSGPIEPPGGGA
jgi:hypothetical protein